MSIGTASFSATQQVTNTFVAKLGGANPQAPTWTELATADGYPQVVRSIATAADPSGNAALVFWAATQSGSTALNFDGTTESSSGSFHGLYRVDAQGNHSWHVRFDDGLVTDVSMYSNGDILVCGTYGPGSGALSDGFNLPEAADPDVWVARYNAIGALEWARRYGGSGADGVADSGARDDEVRCEALDDGGYLVGAYSDGSFSVEGIDVPGTSPSVVVARIDAAGNATWAARTSGDAAIVDVGATDNHALAVMNFTGTTGFETSVTAQNGSSDIFAARLEL